MTPTLLQYLNKTIDVSIPALFGGTEARRCRLIAAEASGLWLVSDELARIVQPAGKIGTSEAAPAIFVPFAQIAAVVPVAVGPAAATAGLKPAAAAATSGTKTQPSKPKK